MYWLTETYQLATVLEKREATMELLQPYWERPNVEMESTASHFLRRSTYLISIMFPFLKINIY